MSDNVSDEEQQQQMEKIFICDDVLLGVFAFIDPIELGLKIALISDRFDALVDVHFKSRKWSLSWLKILRATDGNGAQIDNERSAELLPIPQGPLPNQVIGFEEIEIRYIDQSVMEFLQRIRRLFDSTKTSVYIWTSAVHCSWEIIWQKIWPFVNDNIYTMVLDPARLDRLRLFSPTILCNCPNLRSLSCYGLIPELPAEDNAGASSSQAVAKWLLTAREDGLPKMLSCLFSGRMDGLKRAFVNASKPVNFMLRMRCSDLEPFELQNNLTGETLRLSGDNGLLVRCPIGREEAKWREWEKEALFFDFICQANSRILINFKDCVIGDGMLDESAGPSEPKK